jgi:Na+/H+ antiporter NhaD/arsenite permease-like protein
MSAIAAIIILLTYIGIAVGHIPGLRMNRATIALVGAGALVAMGTIAEKQAIASLDMGTILLLGAMMVINVNLRMSGFFRVVSGRILSLAHSPRILLALVIFSSGILSAIFLNDTICLMVTPIVVDLTLRLKRDPIPYLVGLAAATNIGSVATITGNPQNIIIGQASGITYLNFLLHLGPVAVIGMGICWAVVILSYRKEFNGSLSAVELPPAYPYRPLLIRTSLVVIGLMIAFLAGAPIVTAACIAAGLLLISRLRPTRLLSLEWELLVMFAGLFVVTGAIEATGISKSLFQAATPLIHGGVTSLSLSTAVLSNLVSNVPAVLLLRPEIATLPNAQQAWLTLAMASTLAGNFTLLGSAATLIVAEVAAVRGVKLSFMAFLKAGVPITILTMLVGIIWLNTIA